MSGILSTLSSMFSMSQVPTSYRVTGAEGEVADLLGISDLAFEASRKKDAYDEPEAYLEARVKTLNNLKTSVTDTYNDYMNGTKTPGGIDAKKWVELPHAKRQAIALKAVQSEAELKLISLESYFPDSFKKQARTALKFGALKKALGEA